MNKDFDHVENFTCRGYQKKNIFPPGFIIARKDILFFGFKINLKVAKKVREIHADLIFGSSQCFIHTLCNRLFPILCNSRSYSSFVYTPSPSTDWDFLYWNKCLFLNKFSCYTCQCAVLFFFPHWIYCFRCECTIHIMRKCYIMKDIDKSQFDTNLTDCYLIYIIVAIFSHPHCHSATNSNNTVTIDVIQFISGAKNLKSNKNVCKFLLLFYITAHAMRRSFSYTYGPSRRISKNMTTRKSWIINLTAVVVVVFWTQYFASTNVCVVSASLLKIQR